MDIILYVEVFMCKLNKENKFSYINVNVEVDVFSMKFINGDCEKKKFLCVIYRFMYYCYKSYLFNNLGY